MYLIFTNIFFFKLVYLLVLERASLFEISGSATELCMKEKTTPNEFHQHDTVMITTVLRECICKSIHSNTNFASVCWARAIAFFFFSSERNTQLIVL
jgi:hypothetical protein